MAIILLILPLLFSALLLATKGKLSGKVALFASLITMGFNLYLLMPWMHDNSMLNMSEDWIPNLGITFSLHVDGLTMILLMLTNLLLPGIILISLSSEKIYASSFYALILLMQFGLNGVFMASDGILFYFFWEVTLIPIYFICAMWGSADRIRVTMKFFIYTFFGSLFMLLALIYIHTQSPAHTFRYEDLMAAHLSGRGLFFVYGSFFLAFAIKMPVFPFHTWQPDTYTSSPTQGTMLLSGIMLKMGIYGVMRWMIPLAPEAYEDAGHWMMILAVIGIIYASLIAIRQKDIKRVFAYSSIAHVGMIAAGLFTLDPHAWQGAAFQMIAHGINIVGLFFVSDIIERRLGTRQLADMGGIAKAAPRFATFFMIIMLGSVAVPLTNGFVGEFLLLQGLYNFNPIIAIIAGTSIILCAVYMFRVYQLAMFGETNAETALFKDLDAREMLVLGGLSAAVLVLGIYPNLVFDILGNATQNLLTISLSN